MFQKIIKRGHRKVAKSDVDLAYPPAGWSSESLVVNHASRGGAPPTLSQLHDQTSCACAAAAAAAPEPEPERPPLATIENLPMFRHVLALERHTLFLQKLKLCCVVQFDDAEREIKKQTLIDLVDFIQSGIGKITEANQEEMIRMISVNIFRSLPPASYEITGSEMIELEDEDPFLDPWWPHLHLVYELLLRYVVSPDTDTKVAKRYIDHCFVLKLLNLFESEDPREREYLKTILHRIYGKFMVHRPFIRKAINNIFYRFIYEMPQQRHSGIGELLEILGSIINGFALPMKEEHKLFLARVLIPLHKPKPLPMYHQQLSYCITQFVEKDYKLADTVIMGLLKYWPHINSHKELLFIGELEDVLEATQPVEFQRCLLPLFTQIARSINSPHFQVAERALYLWNSDHFIGLISQNMKVILPIIYEALEKNMESHWNQAVQGLTFNVRKLFAEMDGELFAECGSKYAKTKATSRAEKKRRQVMWQRLAAAASQGWRIID